MIRPLVGIAWTLVAGLIILLAVGLTVARLLLPYADRYQPQIEAWVTRSVGQPVVIGSMTAEWRGLGPHLILADVRVLGADGAPTLRLGRAEIGLNLPLSLLYRAPRIERLIVAGVHLSATRGPDGAIRIAGLNAVPETEARGAERLLGWLLAQGRIAVEHAGVTWIDRPDGGPVLEFRDVNLEMRNSGSRHQLTGSALLPGTFGQRFSFAIDSRGNPLVARGWSAEVYVDGGGLQLAQWTRGAGLGGLHLERGTAEVTAWGQWSAGRLRRVEGRLSASGIGLQAAGAAADQAYLIDGVAGRFRWQGEEDGWRLDVNDFLLERGGRSWPASDFALAESGTAGARRLSAALGYVDLADVAELLSAAELPLAGGDGLLRELRPRGVLRGLRLQVEPDAAGAPARYAAVVRFENLTTEPRGKLPGLRGFSGDARLDQDGGRLTLDTAAAELAFSSLFREPLPLQTLSGRVQWRRGPEGWRVEAQDLAAANEDLQLRARGRLQLPAQPDAVPFLTLFTEFSAASAEHTSRYLPVGIMPPAAVHWLDGAILGGRVPEGTLLFHGPLKGFPFDQGQGRFRTEFAVRGGVLEYAPGWPRISDIDARVVFDGRAMSIAAEHGASLSSTISETAVDIPDLAGKPAVLQVRGRAQGPTGDVLRFLRDSPLDARFDAYLRSAAADGRAGLELDLALPLNHGQAEIKGGLRLEDSTLWLADRAVEITQVNGGLAFTRQGLEASGLQARIFGLPFTASVHSVERRAGTLTRITASGRADVAAIAAALHKKVPPPISGASAWRAGLDIPAAGAKGGHVALWIESDLRGLAIDLPAPLHKTRSEPWPLRVETVLPRAPDRPIRVTLKDRLQAVFDLGPGGRWERGELRLGGEAAELPSEPGLRIAGRMPSLSYSEWRTALAGLAAQPAGQPLVTSVRLAVDDAEFFGRHLHGAQIAADRESSAWSVAVQSKEVEGRINIPMGEAEPWQAELERLRLTKSEANGKAPLDPRVLPAIRVEARHFSYNEIDFGSLSLAASKREAGLRLDKLVLSSASMHIDARGDWVLVSGNQFSSFDIKFDSGDFGAALSQLGFTGTIGKGEAHFDIAARWVGPPTAFALERLDGTLHIAITDGRLLEVEPGPGRIFGLISLQALPRRLALDFSDIFRKGFAFDRLEGNFTVQEGSARTEDLFMDGPAARIDVTGSIDLVAGEYDQTVVVVPNVSSGLPLAGAVAGGVGLGAAILLMERVFRPDIERLTQVTYHVTGHWNDPVIERLQDGAGSDKK